MYVCIIIHLYIYLVSIVNYLNPYVLSRNMVGDAVYLTLILCGFFSVIIVSSRYFAVAQSNVDLWKGRSMTAKRELNKIEALIEKPVLTGGKMPLSKLLSGDIGELITLAKDNPEIIQNLLSKLGIGDFGPAEEEIELMG